MSKFEAGVPRIEPAISGCTAGTAFLPLCAATDLS
jgi:hypothetical protein